jgi:hypothetical protein
MTRTTRNALLLLLFLILLARVPYAATQMDGARDFFTAWRLLHGEEIPLSGPVLAGTVHLGPIWFFALAALLAIGGGNWLVTSMLVGALAALQVPLAYLAGKAIDGRRAGILWACALVLPSWGMFETLLPTHPQFIASTMLAFIVCAARFYAHARRRYLFGMALAFILALHAHPSALCLVWIGAFVVIRAARRGELRAGDVVVSMLIVLAPLLPFLYWDASRGFIDLAATGAFVGHSHLAANLSNAARIVRVTLIDAVPYWFATIQGWSARATTMATVLIVGTTALGLAGGARTLLMPHLRNRAVLAIVLVAAVALTTAGLRDSTPFYMTIPLQVIVAGLVATGLVALGDSSTARAVQRTAMAIAVVFGLVADAGIARIQTRGAWPFAWFPIMDVLQPPSEVAPLMLIPAYAMPASGRFLCAHAPLSVHGGYASLLLQNYAAEMRLQCGQGNLLLGGSEDGREHWLGLSRAMFARLDVEPPMRLGSIGLVRAIPIVSGSAIGIQSGPVYPAYKARIGPVESRLLRIPLAAGQHLVVTNLAFAFDSGYEASATVDGRPLPVRASDHLSRVYACMGCPAGSTSIVELKLTSGNLQDLDVAVF